MSDETGTCKLPTDRDKARDEAIARLAEILADLLADVECRAESEVIINYWVQWRHVADEIARQFSPEETHGRDNNP